MSFRFDAFAFARKVSAAVFSDVLFTARDSANNIGSEIAVDSIIVHLREIFAHRGLGSLVSRATISAFDLFAARLNDPELLTAIELDPRFQTDIAVISALADAALYPGSHTAQIAAVADRLALLYPAFPVYRRERAAALLIGAMHEEVAAIALLREVLEHVRHLDSLQVELQRNARDALKRMEEEAEAFIRPVFWTRKPAPIPGELQPIDFAHVEPDVPGLARPSWLGRLFGR